MTTPTGAIAGVFSRAADTYEDVGVPWFGPIARGLVDELDVAPGEQGCTSCPTPARPSGRGSRRSCRAGGWAFDVRPSGPEQWLAFSWSHGQRAMWEHVPEDERDAVRDRATAVLHEFARRDGRLGFRQDVRHTLGRRP